MGSTAQVFGGNQSLGEDNFNCTVEVDDGVWFKTAGILTASLHITGLAIGETITLHCSNSPTDPPANSENGVAKQTVVGDGSDQFVAVTAPYSLFKKLKINSATATVYFAGVRR
jgi:hypothetical protein